MIKETRSLQGAFLRKEENQNFLSNLERLKAERSVTDEQYAVTKGRYQQDLTVAVSEIANIKSQLKLHLQTTEQNLSKVRAQLEELDIRHKVGELTLEEYQSSQQELMKMIGQTENTIARLQRLIAAKSSAEIGMPPRGVELGLPGRGITMPEVTTEGIFSRLGIASLVIALVMLISVFLPWVSAWGLSVSAMGAGWIGIILLLIALAYGGLTFIGTKKIKGIVHLLIGGCTVVLIVVYLFQAVGKYGGEIVSFIGAGCWLYTLAAIAGIVIGLWELRGS